MTKNIFRVPKHFSYFFKELKTRDFKQWKKLEAEELRWNAPVVNTSMIKKIAYTLRKNQALYLESLPVEKLITQLGQVSLRWLNPEYPLRKKAEWLLSRTTGCPTQIIAEGLTLAFREVQTFHLQSALQSLSSFPRLKITSMIFAGIIPTPMLFDTFLSLLLKSAVIIKSPSREPLFPILLAQSISEVNQNLGRCIAAFWWPGGQWNLEKTLFKETDALYAYGDNETLHQIKSHVSHSKLFLSFGHKISLSVIGEEQFKSNRLKFIAEQVAYDVSLYDQQGCLSPHVVYIENTPEDILKEWIEVLGKAMTHASKIFPPCHNSFGAASKIHQTRGQYQLHKNTICISSHPKPDWTIIYEKDPHFHPSCLNRVLFVKPILKIGNLIKSLSRYKGSIQGLGYSLAPKRMNQLRKIKERLEIPMLLPVGSMQAITFQQHIDERMNLLQCIKKS